MYVSPNFRTKKALQEAVKEGKKIVTVYNPGPFADPPHNGHCAVEGPHYPESHTWYAQVNIENGQVVKVT